ncbi:MAG: phage protease [Puniceicoccales bacterium]|jgi:phage I-like protein|nr:phage protease [Puniceicoccales bacterium]
MDKVLQGIPWPEATSTASAARRWLRLSAYGHYPHPQGLQCIDRAAAQAMVEHFKSFRGRLRRRFGGLPVYIGHPDDPQLRQQPGHQDTRAYAWIQNLEAREDGLHGLVKWSDAGLELLRNAFFKFLSPRWEMQAVGPGQFRPIRLLSLGLTNHPNIPGDAIANQEAREGEAPAPDTREEASREKVFQEEDIREKTSLSRKKDFREEASRERAPEISPDPPASADDTPREEMENTPREGTEGTLKEGMEGILRKDAETSAELEHFLAQGLNGGHILPNECTVWARRYGEDPERAGEEMRAQQHGLHLQAHSASLQGAHPSAASREQLLSHVHRRIRDFGESYTEAWAAVRQSHPQLF